MAGRGWLLRVPDWLLVFAAALGLRLAFAVLTAGSYDPDEFVILSLSKHFAQGAVPYRDFTFFHPPGILVLFRLLQPLTDLWWPAGRLLMALLDSLTAVMVWRIGVMLYGRRTALAAGLLYAVSPIALLASVRIGQDPMITALGTAGLLALLAVRRRPGTVLAGICLGLAIWFKYPAVLFVPVYLIAAPRRAVLTLGVAAATLAIALAPFYGELGTLLSDSIGWQSHRAASGVAQRIGAVGAFWLLLNPLGGLAVIWLFAVRFSLFGARAADGSQEVDQLVSSSVRQSPELSTQNSKLKTQNSKLKTPRPEQRTANSERRAILAGFFIVVVFLASAQVYYHYFMVVVPFAALLGAPLLADRRTGRAALAAVVLLVTMWSVAVDLGPVQAGLGQLSLDDAHTAARLIEQRISPQASILTDQFEYAYFSGRRPLLDYFWDMRDTVSARTLERRLHNVQAVVATGDPTASFPPALVAYLERSHLPTVHVHGITIWFVPGGLEF